jgi:O-acetyl-ADP-ribose deacetylase
MQVQIAEGDLLTQNVDAIINSWNKNIIPWWLLLPQGVSGAIKKRAGFQPFRELARLGRIPLGGAVYTSAGKLPFRAIIHVAGIDMLGRSSEQSIRECARNAVTLANKLKLVSLAFPLIGTSSGNMDPAKGEQILLDELSKTKSEITAVIVRTGRRRTVLG